MKVDLLTTVALFDNDVWEHYLPVSGAVVKPLLQGYDDRRVLCSIRGDAPFPCALMPKGQDYFILVNKQVKKKHQLTTGVEVAISLEKDTSEYGMPLPEEMEMVLLEDPYGKAYFDALTIGKRRSLIHLIAKVKNSDSRVRKALALMHHLHENRGELDFKALMDTIKLFNARIKKQ